MLCDCMTAGPAAADGQDVIGAGSLDETSEVAATGRGLLTADEERLIPSAAHDPVGKFPEPLQQKMLQCVWVVTMHLPWS